MDEAKNTTLPMPGRSGPVLYAALATAAVVMFFWYASFVAAGGTRSVDLSIREYFYSLSSPALTIIVSAISYTGKVKVLVGLGAIVVVLLIYFKKYRWMIVFLVTMIGEAVIEVSLKAIYRRPRPDPFFDLPPAESFSFPSGHALGALCFYGIVAWLVMGSIRNFQLKIVIATFTAALIISIGLARIYLGMHYPSDVAGGFFAGITWMCIVILADKLFRDRSVSISK